MPYYLSMGSGGVYRDFTFEIETVSAKGWVGLRVVRIEDSIEPTVRPLYDTLYKQSIRIYDPATDNGNNCHMSHLWRARSHMYNGERYYTLVGAFGNPHGRIELDNTPPPERAPPPTT